MDDEALTSVFQEDLDEETFAALMRDLHALPTACLVTVKRGARDMVGEQSNWPLDAAKDALLSGQVRAIQVRYEHEGALWVDTILKLPSAFRLVRVEQPGAPR